MALRAGLPVQDMEFIQFHPTGVYGAGCLITEACAARAATSPTRPASVSWSVTRRRPRTSPRATSSAGDDRRDPRRPRLRPNKDYIELHVEHLDPKVIHERLPGIAETARIFAGVDVTRQPIPILPTCHYNMGGIPTNLHSEVVTVKDGDPDTVIPA